MKRKFIFPKYTKIALIMSCMFHGINLMVKFLEKSNIYIYFFKLGVEEIVPISKIFCIAFLISAMAVLFYKNTKHKILVILSTTVFSLFAFSYLLLYSLLSMNGRYFEYSSDDKKHNIVVNECSFLFGGWGDIYEKTSFCTMKRVGSYSTDDGFRPFTNNAFYFVWNEKNFELHHSVFGSLDEEYDVVKMDYIN